MKRQERASSPSTARICRMHVFSPWSKSTLTSSPQSSCRIGRFLVGQGSRPPYLSQFYIKITCAHGNASPACVCSEAEETARYVQDKETCWDCDHLRGFL